MVEKKVIKKERTSCKKCNARPVLNNYGFCVAHMLLIGSESVTPRFYNFKSVTTAPSISLSQIQRAHIFRVRYSVLKYLESDTACSQVFRVRHSVFESSLAVT